MQVTLDIAATIHTHRVNVIAYRAWDKIGWAIALPQDGDRLLVQSKPVFDTEDAAIAHGERFVAFVRAMRGLCFATLRCHYPDSPTDQN